MYHKTLILSLLVCLFVSGSWAMGKAPTSAARKSAEAIDFTLEDLAGREHRLSDYRGKIVFLNFWATWCPPCRAEMPAMQRLYKSWDSKKYVMLAVNIGESKKTVGSFVSNNGYTFPVLLDRDKKVAAKYRVRGIPTTYIIDDRGDIITRIVGAREWSLNGFQHLVR